MKIQKIIKNLLNIKGIIKYFSFKLSPFEKFLLFLQFYYIYQVFVTNDVGGFSFTTQTFFYIAISMFTVALLFKIISFFLKSRLGISLMAYFYILCFGLLSAYLFKTGEHLDWSVLADNITSSFSKEALTVMAGSLDPGTFLYVPVIIVIFIIFEVWKKAVSKGIQQNKHIFKFIILVTTYLFLLLIPIDSYDPIMSFFEHPSIIIIIQIT